MVQKRNESGRFGALKSDSTHHFFRNACTKSGVWQINFQKIEGFEKRRKLLQNETKYLQ
jgi:hypothetical protein